MSATTAHPAPGTVVRLGAVRSARPRPLSGNGVVAQGIRFLLCGGTANVAYVLAFVTLADLGQQAANAVGAGTSAVLASELHRRFTFRAGARVHWRTAQWQGGVTAAAATLASSLSLSWLAATTDAGTLLALVVAAAVNGAVGVLRFVTLRWLFAGRAAVLPVVLPARPAPLPAASAA